MVGQDSARGRIYRISDPGHRDTPEVKEVQHLLQSDWSGRTTEQLSENLGHADRRVRLEAQWELARRGDKETLLAVAANQEAASPARLHAVWGADQIARLDQRVTEQILTSLRPLLDDAQTPIRAAAAKVMGERGDTEAAARLRELLSDESPRVRYFATFSLAKLEDAEAFAAVVRMLAENADADPAIRHACIRYLTQIKDPAIIAALKDHESVAVRRAAVVALRNGRNVELRDFLDDASSLVVSEAARAIYDQPVPAAMNALAALPMAAGSDIELVRRILHANYRLGNGEAASRVAQYAGRTSATPEMRIEAMELLAAWANPDPRDRVLNAFRPLKARDLKLASDALLPQVDSLMASQESVREKGIEVAAALGIKKIAPLLVTRTRDSQLGPEARATALTALARLDTGKAVELARQVKMVPASELLHAALRVLSRYDVEASLPRFVEATQSRNMEVRQLAWDILARSESAEALAAVVAGVQSYLDGDLPADVHLNVRDAAKGKLDDALQAALVEHDRSLADADPLAPWLIALEGGDVDRGRKIFFEETKLSCVRCHKVDRAGGEVGPNLTVIGKQKDRRYLLESICLPNAQIAKGFETAVIADDAGDVYTGIVKSENSDFVELIHNDGSQSRIPIDEIVARKKGQSSMPADLTNFMNLRQLRDLVAYLASLQVDPRAATDTE